MKRINSGLISSTIWLAWPLSIIVFLPSVVTASRAEHRKEFRVKDTNRDGRLNWAECRAVYQKRFNRLDQNGDGFLTLDDLETIGVKLALLSGMAPFKAGEKDKLANKLKKMDANLDDLVDLNEFLICRRRQFEAMDTDRNSVVVLAEYLAHKSAVDAESED